MTNPERPLSAVPRPDFVDGTEPAPSAMSIQYEQRDGALGSTLPQFEGKDVEYTGAKITSVGSLEIDDAVWPVDHYVRMVVECRVVGIDHKVNEKTGKLGRVHVLKAIDSKVIDWDRQL